jgi:hypothetical protein
VLLLVPLPLLAGCGATRPVVRGTPARPPAAADGYRVGCPDAVEVRFAGRPEWDAVAAVDVDGTLPVADARPRVAGLTAAEAAAAVAAAAGLPADAVTLTVADPRSARVFVTGPADRRTRTVPYRGPVPAADLLAGIGVARPAAVSVVRANVAAGTPPEIFTDPAVPLQPGDHVYVSESRLAEFARLLPPWAEPGFSRLFRLAIE